jgi:hypothetical protein
LTIVTPANLDSYCKAVNEGVSARQRRGN